MPSNTVRVVACLAAAAALGGSGAASAQAAAEPDPLALEATPVAEAVQAPALRVAVEAGLGRVDQRGEVGRRDGHRFSIDMRYATTLSDAWRVVLSDRFDHTKPVLPGQAADVNSLREAYVGWQADSGLIAAELGRVNLRQGPAYGYNPTDYFRIGGLRSITTADPVALRERRMGTVMLRLGQLWSTGGATLALAPKLQSRDRDGWYGDDTFSLGLGATNGSHRALLSANQKLSDRVGGQVSLLLEHDASAQLGFSLTALATDALVAYAEVSTGRTHDLIDQIRGTEGERSRRQKLALGATYTLPSGLSVTVESEYNGAGLDRGDGRQLSALGVAGYQRYLALTQPSQELGSKRALLVYLSQKNLFVKQLDLTAFVRRNESDHSGIGWAELRYHWPRFDAVLQWQRSFGDRGTEFGVMPYRQVLQLIGVFYL